MKSEFCKYGCGRKRGHHRSDCNACHSAIAEKKKKESGLCLKGCGRPLFNASTCKACTIVKRLGCFGIGKEDPKRIQEALTVAEHGANCAYCGRLTQFEHGYYGISPDHVVPKSRGGDDSWSNFAWCCWSCQRTKNNMTGDEFKKEALELAAGWIKNFG